MIISRYVLLSTAFAGMTILANSFASLISDSPDEAVAQIETIVRKKDGAPATIRELTTALKHPDTNIRVKERAAWALGELRAKSAIPTLIEASKHKGLLVRSAALDALVRLRAHAALPVFVSIANEDPILTLRQRATLALGLLQTDKAIDPLVKLSDDPAPEIQGAATLAMAATHSKKNDFSEIIGGMTKNANPYVQERAKVGLDIVHRKNAAMLTHLSSDDVDIRLFSALYFLKNGASKDLKQLKKAWNSEADEETRDQLEKSIAAIKRRAGQAAKTTTPTTRTKKHH